MSVFFRNAEKVFITKMLQVLPAFFGLNGFGEESFGRRAFRLSPFRVDRSSEDLSPFEKHAMSFSRGPLIINLE